MLRITESFRAIAGRRRGALSSLAAGLLGVLILAGCSTGSNVASCNEFMTEFEQLGNPEVTEMVKDAFFAKYPDQESVTGGTLMDNITRVHDGCEANPEANIDQFIEHDPNGEASAQTTEPIEATESPPTEARQEQQPFLAGSFEATPGEGYTVEIGYTLDDLETEVDIANAEPGEAIVYATPLGEATITNTTPRRNTEVELPQFYMQLLWDEPQIPGKITRGILEPEEGVCGIEFREASYCNLASVYFQLADEAAYEYGDPTTLAPSETLSMPTTTPDPAPFWPGPYGSRIVKEGSANAMARFIRSTKPDLAYVYGGRSIWPELNMSCATDAPEGAGQASAENGPLAIVAADGDVLLSGGGVERYATWPLMCFEA